MKHIAANMAYLALAVLALPACRQQPDAPHIHWEVAAILPCLSNGPGHLGLAGAVSGFSGQHYLIGGGANFPEAMPWEGGEKKYHDTLYIGGISANDQLMPLRYAACLPQAVAYAAQVQQADTLWVLGGETPQGPTAACYGITLRQGTVQYIPLPPLPVATASAAACLLEHALYVAGGHTSQGTTAQVWALQLHLPQPQWQAVAPLPLPASHAVLLPQMQSGAAPLLHFIGGRCQRPGRTSVFYRQVWQQAVGDAAWVEGTALPTALSAHAGAVLPNEEMIIIGGDDGATFHKVEEIWLQLAQTTDSAASIALMAQKAALQAGHPGFSRQVWRWDSPSNSWLPAGELPFAAPVTTHAVVRGQAVWLGSGEVKAGIRTPHIIQGTLQAAQPGNFVAQ